MSRRRIKRPATEPKKKISETLIKFAEPMLDMVGTDAPQDTIKETFMMAVTVWNAVVFEQLGKGSHYVDETRAQIQSGNMPVMTALIDHMIERKRTMFSDNLLLIGHHEVVFKPDGSEFVVRADGRVLPETVIVDGPTT